MYFLRLLVLIWLGFSAGCATLDPHLEKAKVKAWQKGAFTKPGMQWTGPGSETKIRDHIFFSKEAANGRPSLTGGGCGCN